jgi:hypothetical protein
MDYVKVESLYKELGQEQEKKFKETADYNRYRKELRWYDDVRSKRTGEYYQANELIRRDLVAKKWTPPHIDENQKPLEYPLKYVTAIYRVRTADMSEWLMTTQTWYGLDVFGNVLNISMDFKERFDSITPVYANKLKNPKDRESEMVLEITSIRHTMKYTLPFTPENCDELYSKRNGKCLLVLKDESKDIPPYAMDSFDHLKTRTFDELWDWVTIPRTKMDRSVNDQLQYRQYS